MKDEKLYPYEILLDGKLIMSEDKTTIGKNFKSLKNFRYGAKHLKAVTGGMSKINSTVTSN